MARWDISDSTPACRRVSEWVVVVMVNQEWLIEVGGRSREGQ